MDIQQHMWKHLYQRKKTQNLMSLFSYEMMENGVIFDTIFLHKAVNVQI